MDKVSICMPVYNGGAYFKKALESALAQDYENLEIVVVNDGSTDNGETESIALEYKSRVKYFRQENRGVAGALNTAIRIATGDYFAWLSHDDIHLPNKTSAQIRFLRELGKSDACLFSDYDLIGPSDELIYKAAKDARSLHLKPRTALLNGNINGCTLLIPMWMMRKYGPFDESLRYTQDYDFWNRIVQDHEFFHQPECLVHYRLHPGQDSQKPLAVTEGDALWQRMITGPSETERAQLFGSTRRYFEKMGEFLDNTPYKQAAAVAHAGADDMSRDVLASVIVPFYNEVPLAIRAAKSALDQRDATVELIPVNDGSTEDLTPLRELCNADSRVRLLHQANMGPAAARNAGLLVANGQYIAFLDGDDIFLPTKISRQVGLMQQHGALVSHTSYYISYPESRSGLGIWHSGTFGGCVYPAIIEVCPIAMPTVMLHRSVADEGFVFPTESRIGEDVLAWIDLATRYLVLGIDEPLSIVEWSSSSAALSAEKQTIGLSNLISVLSEHKLHSLQKLQIDGLRGALSRIAKSWAEAGRQFSHDVGDEKYLTDAAWGALGDFSLDANGRVQYFEGKVK